MKPIKILFFALAFVLSLTTQAQVFYNLPSAGTVTISDSCIIHRPGSYYKSALANWPFATTSSLAAYLPLAGGTMSGNINMNTRELTSTTALKFTSGQTLSYSTVAGVPTLGPVFDGSDYSFYLNSSSAGTNGDEVRLNNHVRVTDLAMSTTSLNVTGSLGQGYLTLPRQTSSPSNFGDGQFWINNSYDLVWRNNNNNFQRIFSGTLSANRTYTLPDASGTLALTSDLANYLPLAGGTMLGDINMGGKDITGSNIYLKVDDNYTKGWQELTQGYSVMGFGGDQMYVDNTGMAFDVSGVGHNMYFSSNTGDINLSAYGNANMAATNNLVLSSDTISIGVTLPYGANELNIGGASTEINITGDTKLNSLTASTVPYLDASKKITSLANSAGALTNDGSGGLSWTPAGAGTVTSVSVVTANGVSGSVATATTTPAITLSLGAITPTTVNGNTITTGTGTLTLGAGKTLTASNSLTLAGTDATVMTFPTTSATIARTDAANTFAGIQTLPAGLISAPSIQFTGSATNTGIYNSAANTVNIGISGTSIAAFSSGATNLSGTTTTAVLKATSLDLLDATYKSVLDVSASTTVRIANGFSTLNIAPASVLFPGTVVIQSNGATPGITIAAGSTNANGVIIGRNAAMSSTSGTFNLLSVMNTFAPTTGSANFVGVAGMPTINQTNGGVAPTGVIAIYEANPVVTSVITSLYGFRSRLTASPTGGGTAYNIYADGTAPNLFGGTVTMKGFADASSASAGNVGEVIASGTSTYTNYTTTATYQAVDSITLTAGDWDLSAFFTYSSNSATITAASNSIFVISTTKASASGATEGMNIAYVPQSALLGTSKFSDAISPYQVTISSTTKYYLNSQATFTIGNPQYVGRIRARRIR